MKTGDFDYHLPPHLIAQTPVEPRDRSRLMAVPRDGGAIEHAHFLELGHYLQAGDVLVFNDSRVIPARLLGRWQSTGGKVELLLLRRQEIGLWQALVKPGKKAVLGSFLEVEGATQGDEQVLGEVVGRAGDGTALIRFSNEAHLEDLGHVPLPPYIRTPLATPERYQTVYAQKNGSAAAPTAGLHFTTELLDGLTDMGVRFVFVTLHVGLDTFSPVREEDPREHAIHSEWGELSLEAAAELTTAKREGRRIICVGTTAVRMVEQSALWADGSGFVPISGWVELYILFPHRFRGVDGLLTNFHLPRSTLLILVSAFVGRDRLLAAYTEAIQKKYRFYSFGDCMLIS